MPFIALASITVLSFLSPVLAEKPELVIEEVHTKEVNLDSLITSYSDEFNVSENLARRIIGCESGFNPDATNKNYKGDVHWSTDIGMGQINDYYHKTRMDEMGLDIYDHEDNLRYTFILLSEGETHYKASKFCWNNG